MIISSWCKNCARIDIFHVQRLLLGNVGNIGALSQDGLMAILCVLYVEILYVRYVEILCVLYVAIFQML